jgi:hypothetical protein
MFLPITGAVCVPSEVRVALRHVYQSALRAADIKHETVAHLQGISREQWSQQIYGDGHPSMARLAMLRDDPDGLRFLNYYLPLYAQMVSVWQIDAQAAQLERLTVELRMAKASVEPVAVRKRA